MSKDPSKNKIVSESARVENSNTKILLVNLGTPQAPSFLEVLRFLSEFLWDPCVLEVPWFIRLGIQTFLPWRAKKISKLYQRIWLNEGSPLQVYSQRLGKALQQALQPACSFPVSIHVAMTYGSPNIPTVLNEIFQDNTTRLIVLPLFPQFSKTTTGAVWHKLRKACSKYSNVPLLHCIHEYANDEIYIEALANSICQFWEEKGRSERLLFSFHGIPLRNVVRGDNYPFVCQKLAETVAKRLEIPAHSYAISFQSRFGFYPWVQPYTDQVLGDWGRQGVQSVDVISPSFAVDCLETLEELNIQMRELFLSRGGKQYRYIPALNDDTIHVNALKGLIQKIF